MDHFPQDRAQPLAIAVFAHNEQDRIATALTRLLDSGIRNTVPIHVLANGCRDRTESIVADFAARRAQVRLHTIARGDKANAWNHYIHVIREQAQAHCFVDGDVEVQPGCFDALHAALTGTHGALAATGVPASGRHRAAWIHELQTTGGLVGNLYALSGSFVDRIRSMGLKIPVGTIGEDGFVGAMAAFDLDPARGWDAHRIAVVPQARFVFHSLDWRRPDDIRLYLRRRRRYALRGIQNRMLQRLVKSQGFFGLPDNIRDAYSRYPEYLEPGWRGLDTAFHWLALRQIAGETRSPTLQRRTDAE
jgi:glycosyltransferase involved in cell wall biosynthesis